MHCTEAQRYSGLLNRFLRKLWIFSHTSSVLHSNTNCFPRAQVPFNKFEIQEVIVSVPFSLSLTHFLLIPTRPRPLCLTAVTYVIQEFSLCRFPIKAFLSYVFTFLLAFPPVSQTRPVLLLQY
jgi:hypothetical protein